MIHITINSGIVCLFYPGPDRQTDAATQIRWGLTYIKNTYGSPCGAWSHEQADGWY